MKRNKYKRFTLGRNSRKLDEADRELQKEVEEEVLNSLRDQDNEENAPRRSGRISSLLKGLRRDAEPNKESQDDLSVHITQVNQEWNKRQSDSHSSSSGRSLSEAGSFSASPSSSSNNRRYVISDEGTGDNELKRVIRREESSYIPSKRPSLDRPDCRGKQACDTNQKWKTSAIRTKEPADRLEDISSSREVTSTKDAASFSAQNATSISAKIDSVSSFNEESGYQIVYSSKAPVKRNTAKNIMENSDWEKTTAYQNLNRKKHRLHLPFSRRKADRSREELHTASLDREKKIKLPFFKRKNRARRNESVSAASLDDEKSRFYRLRRQLSKNIFFWAGLFVFIIAAALYLPQALSASSTAGDRELPIYSVETGEKKVALSFDAAWGNEDTQQILDILAAHDVKVTFFMTGQWISNYPEDVKAIAAAGHDLGNHSNTHPQMGSLSSEEIKEELMSTHEKVKELTGIEMNLFRPPYGDYSNNLVTVTMECGYYPIQWSVDSLDWKDYGRDSIVKTVCEHKGLGNGAIILMHNGATYTAQALDEIITNLEEQGYEIVPISELIYTENYHMDTTGRQIAD